MTATASFLSLRARLCKRGEATCRVRCAPALFLTAMLLSPIAWTEETTLDKANLSSEPYTLERISKQFTMNSGQRVILNNRWGDIRIGQTGGKQLIVHGVMQKIGNQPKVGNLLSELRGETQDTLYLELVYPSDQSPESFSEGRIDMSLLVPYGIPVEVYAERGRVITKSMESPLTVHATEESVSVKSKAWVDISSHSGDILLTLLASEVQQRGKIQSLSGDIELRYYKDQNLALEMMSGASKSTNDLTLLQSRRVEGHRVFMHKGEQSPQLYLQNDTGHIIINDLAAEYVDDKDEHF